MHVPRRLINGLVDIIYPKKCLACKRKLAKAAANDFICSRCWGEIKKNVPPFCRLCGRHLEIKINTGNICSTCIEKPLSFDRAFSPCVYEGVIKELIHGFKYKNKDYLGETLSSLMIEFIKGYNLDMNDLDLIIPMPLHTARLREREFNQAEILSNHIGKEFNKHVANNILIRRTLKKPQVELKNEERFSNIAGSFALNQKNPVKGKNILLIDDVLTTGATASEAAATLKSGQANIVFVMTLAN
jgi:ComF family protein